MQAPAHRYAGQLHNDSHHDRYPVLTTGHGMLIHQSSVCHAPCFLNVVVLVSVCFSLKLSTKCSLICAWCCLHVHRLQSCNSMCGQLEHMLHRSGHQCMPECSCWSSRSQALHCTGSSIHWRPGAVERERYSLSELCSTPAGHQGNPWPDKQGTGCLPCGFDRSQSFQSCQHSGEQIQRCSTSKKASRAFGVFTFCAHEQCQM